MLYLNHAGTSWPKPRPVQEAMMRALASSPSDWADEFRSQHGQVCEAFGVVDPSRLLLTPGATSALSIAVNDHDWQPGDRIVLSAMEHHALARPAQQLAARGVQVHWVARGNESVLDLDALESVLKLGSVRLVAMTAASNVTGELLPLEDILRLAREYGALTLVDIAQTAGWVPVEASDGPDLFALTGHKGPQAPWGIGALYVAPHVSMHSPQAVCELPRDADGVGPTACSIMPGYCDGGSVDRVALAGLAAGLQWLSRRDPGERLQEARDQVARLVETALEWGARLHGTPSSAGRMPTAALTVKERTSAELAAALAQRGLIAGSGLQCAPLAHESLGTAADGVLRLSVGPATSAGDIDEAVETLKSVLRR